MVSNPAPVMTAKRTVRSSFDGRYFSSTGIERPPDRREQGPEIARSEDHPLKASGVAARHDDEHSHQAYRNPGDLAQRHALSPKKTGEHDDQDRRRRVNQANIRRRGGLSCQIDRHAADTHAERAECQ